ncbi:MAG: ABC transporter permease [Ktedonobacterales bacterium]
MAIKTIEITPHTAYPLPSTPRAAWLIAQRSALESLRDRTTVITSSILALVVPIVIVLTVIRPAALHLATPPARAGFGTLLALYIYIVGMFPSSGAVSIASGVFAGEKERGCLTPLLVTPASNVALFIGKVLGAVVPALLYSAVAVASFFVEVVLLVGPDKLQLVPSIHALAMLALVPSVAILGAAIASLISSRVRTYNSAQTFASLLLLPVMALLFVLAVILQSWNPWLQFLAVFGVFALDLIVLTLGAMTWRREEVLAQQ